MEMAFAAQILPEFRAYGRQSGNYWLINIKMPADCFVPRLVTENAPPVIDLSACSNKRVG
jgi:hypothetical protein